MTQVRSISKLYTSTGAFDGFRAITSIGNLDGTDRMIEFRRSSLPGNVRNKTAQEIETYINNWLTTNLAGYPTKYQVKVHAVDPFNVDAVCSTQLIPPNWWDNTES